MAKELPYLPSYKNVGLLFEKIKSAKVPEVFSQSFLADTLGLKSKTDRPLIALLKTLGFLDSTGKPTNQYAALKNESVASHEIAKGVRSAYEPLFAANEKAHSLEGQELRGLVAQVAGSDSNTTTKILGTFKALSNLADFEVTTPPSEEVIERKGNQDEEEVWENNDPKPPSNMRPEFHYNIQIHLPSNGSEETYMNIFNAVRKVFK
jgi:hypothetical protein